MESFAKTINTSGRRSGSDFGAVFPECRDSELRSRVVKAIYTTRKLESKSLDCDEIREVVAYITELENTILMQHADKIGSDAILGRLVSSTGLDIKSILDDMDTLVAEDS